MAAAAAGGTLAIGKANYKVHTAESSKTHKSNPDLPCRSGSILVVWCIVFRMKFRNSPLANLKWLLNNFARN